MRRRVVVTGMGFVTPHGRDPAEIFRRLFAGEAAIQRIHSGRPPLDADVIVGLADWRPEEAGTALQRVVMDPVAQMGFLAGKQALEQAGLVGDKEILGRAGVYFGCGLGGAATTEEEYERYYHGTRRRGKPTAVARIMPNAAAAHISMEFGIRGPSNTYSVACTSSATAIGEAYRAIRDGYLECAVTGGAEAILVGGVLIAWESMGVIAPEHPEGPGASIRPFDSGRRGFALGEGAASLILESEEQARGRGAPILGEIVGYGTTSDAFNLTQPSQEGQVRAILDALADAGLPPEAVGYVNAHATATPVGDVVEIKALKEAFGPHAGRLAVSATKSMHGHLVGAAGAVELGITLMALQHGKIPPTANLTDPDPECDLDCVPLVGREAPDLEVALSNSFGFGGANVCLVVRRADG
ncbi:MAG: 3-oxoacyl-[acyl-carrier-protein] synthase 2 [Gemmatimonadota bacterium]